MSTNVIFFSMKDANSKKLCEYIIQNGVGPAFKYANIDDPNVFKNRPQSIRSIPTIYIQETGQAYSGKNAFEFVKTIIVQKVQMQQMREQQQQQQQRPQMMQGQEMFEAPPGRQMPQNRQPQEMRQMPAQMMQAQDGRNGGLPAVNANQIQTAIQNKKDNGIGDLFQKEGITPFVGAEMCDGDQCYGFLENDSSIVGTYTFIGSDGNFVNAASARQGQQSQQRQQKQQREEFMPPGLRSAETKGNKSGMDMDRAFEQFTANRNSEFAPVRRF